MSSINDNIIDSTSETEEKNNTTIQEQVEISDAKVSEQIVQPTKKSSKAKNVLAKGPSKLKGAFSELKKVSWPSFNKVLKETAVVLSVTAIFLLVVIGIDQLLYLLYQLLTQNM